MGEKRILIADANPKAWEDLRKILGETWIVCGAPDSSSAAAQAAQQTFEAVLAHFELPPSGAGEFLNQIRASHPKTLRFVIGSESSKEKVLDQVVGGHQFLSYPFDRATVVNGVERVTALDFGMKSSLRELVSRIRTFPTLPSLYFEVLNALKNPNATTADVGAVLAKDLAMTTKLVQVLNSAYFGLSRKITDPTEAVGLLGFETVKSLIISIKLLSDYDKVKPVYFSIDTVWRHSTAVAQRAKNIALMETNNSECAAHCYTAGLMHDLGKVILAANFDGQYQEAHALARTRQTPLWEVERDTFGANHAEIGAYLLSLWGLTPDVVEAAAFHHHPFRATNREFSPLTAVHVANALEYEGIEAESDLPAPMVDKDYIEALGLIDRMAAWRALKTNTGSAQLDTKTRQPKPTPSISAPPAQASPLTPVTVIPERITFTFNLRQWLRFALAAAVVVALFSVIDVLRLKHHYALLEARSPQTSPALPGSPAPAPSIPKPASTAPAPPPTKSSLVAAAPTPAAAAAAPVPGKLLSALDRVKVQAIFFSTQKPSALINGQLAYTGQTVADCRILDISTATVTLEHQNERRTFHLGQ